MTNLKDTQNEDVKILLVDDNENNLYSLELLLAKQGRAFVKALSGPEALKYALNEEFALIILDIQMPGMDGFEVARELGKSEKTKYTSFIFVTAFASDGEKILEGYETGALDYLVKPLDPSITRAKVNAFLQRHMEQKKLQQRNTELEDLGKFVKDTSDIFISLLPGDLVVEYANQACIDFLGYSKDILIGSPLPSILDNESENAIKSAISLGIVTSLELKVKSAENDYKWLSISLQPMSSKWYLSAKDITYRKKKDGQFINKEVEDVFDTTLEGNPTNAGDAFLDFDALLK